METEEQAKEILQVLRTIYQRQLACDFIIEVTESTVMEFRVHKAMLAAFSRKFRKLLETGQLENDRYQVQAIDSVTMGQLIDYIYTGNLDINAHTALPILAAATLLDMTQVMAMCQRFLMSNLESGQQQHAAPANHSTSGNTYVMSNSQNVETSVKADVGDISESKEQLRCVIRDSGIVKCEDNQLEVKDALHKRKSSKRKGGGKRAERNKRRKPQTVKRKHKKKMVSESESINSASDTEDLCDQTKDDKQTVPCRRSHRSQHQNRNNRIVMTAASRSSSSGYGSSFYVKQSRKSLEESCKTKNIRNQLLNSFGKEECSQSHQDISDLSPSLPIAKLTFHNLKCSICHDVFIHYSAKVLHEKSHHYRRLNWLGVLQRRYMPLYIRQYFWTISVTGPEGQDRTPKKKSTQRRYGDQRLENVVNSRHGHSGHSESYNSNMDIKYSRIVSQTGNHDVSQGGESYFSYANEPDIPQASELSQAGEVLQAGNPDALTQPVFEDSRTSYTSISHKPNDVDVHINLTAAGIWPTKNSSTEKEHGNSDCSFHSDNQTKHVVKETLDNSKQAREVSGKLYPLEKNISINGSDLKSVMLDGSRVIKKALNGIKTENSEPSLNGIKEINNVLSRHIGDTLTGRRKTKKAEQKLKFKGNLRLIPRCRCKLCNVRLPFSLRLLHCLQRHGFQRQCRKCSLTLLQPAACVYHRLKMHRSELRIRNSETLTCAHCGKQFLYAQVLKQHCIRFHGGPPVGDVCPVQVRSLICRHCQCAFKYHKALLIHLPIHGLTQDEIELELTSPASVLLRSKINNRKPGQPKKCPVCARLFKAMTTLRQHMNQVHGLPVTRAYIMHMKNMDVKKIQCQEDGCKFSTIMVYELERHMRTCHPSASYECHFCLYKTALKKRMARHIRLNHMAGKTCEMCGRQFHKHYYLKHHYFKAHNILDPTIKLHKCPEKGCDYSSLTMYSLDIHLRKHNNDKPYKCSECGRMLKTEKNLEKHMNKIHRGIRPYICDQCGASYGEESELKTHMARHEEAKRYHCMYCDYTTQEKGNYQSHLWARHKVKLHQKQTVFECKKCDYTTDRKTRFTQHMASHNNIRNFKCPHCDKTFIAKNTMTSHIKWTHMVKSMACDYCNHKTSTLNMLREHVRMMHTHRDVKPYKCAYCEYHCRTSGNCRKHCTNKHKEQPIKWVKVCEKYPNNDRPVLSMEHMAKENGILRKDSRTKRVFSYELDADVPPGEIKQPPADVQLLPQEVTTQREVPAMQQRLSGISPVMVTGSEVHAQLQPVLTPVLHESHIQLMQQVHKPGEYQQQQQHQQPPSQQQQPQPESLQHQYLSPIIINPSPMPPMQQQQLLVLMQQHGLKNQ